MTVTIVEAIRPAGGPWLRRAELVGVSFPDRTIEVIVIPYEQEAEVPHPTKRSIRVTEVISRGAFDGIERRANRIRFNRDHDEARTFGKAVAFHPGHQKGLHGKFRVAQTPLGDETLALADDGCLDASAGFWPMQGGLRWENPDRYRIDKAFLHHVALVPDGAYGENAGVLAVRQTQPVDPGERPATPILDSLENQRWAAELAAIDAKYGST